MLKQLKSFFKLLTQRPHIPDRQKSNEMVATILNRRSCREFSDADIDEDDFNLILEAGRFAPSTANLQTWSFITFNRNEWREVFGRPIPFNGARAIVVCADSYRNNLFLTEFSHTPFVSHSFSIFNAGLAAMNMSITVECLGIRSIMLSDTGMTGLLDFSHLKEHLSLPEDVIPITTLVLGRSHKSDSVAPPRLNCNTVVMKKSYRQSSQEELEEWFERMKVGFKFLHPFSDLSSKISYYQGKMEVAEKELKRLFMKEKENDRSEG
jgi:FMN reductase [NAD(P)H]